MIGVTALHADDTRVFMNQSNSTWTLSHTASGDPFKNTVTFTLDDKATSPGDNDTVDLPPHSRLEVKFKVPRTDGYLQSFLLSKKGSNKTSSFSAQYPKVSFFNMKKRAPVHLTTKETNLTSFVLNKPLIGDLTILPETPAKAASVPYLIVNKTSNDWTLSTASGKGTLKKVVNPNDSSKDVALPATILKNDRLLIRMTEDASASLDLTFKLACTSAVPGGVPPTGSYTLNIQKQAVEGGVDLLKITQKDPANLNNSWVFTNRFTVDGYFELEDPDQELDFGIEDIN
jgi:hypothetical protein